MVHVGITREGPRVTLALRTHDGERRVLLVVHRRGAAALGVAIRDAADADDDCDRELAVRGELDAHTEAA